METINKEKLRLTGLYKQQLVIYQKIYAIAEQQYQFCMNVELVANSSLNEFNHLILKRRELMELIDKTNKEMEDIKLQLERGLYFGAGGGEDSPKDDPLMEMNGPQEITVKIKVLLKEIITLDHMVKTFFQRNIEMFQNKIVGIQTERKLLKKYYQMPQQKEGYFIDHSK